MSNRVEALRRSFKIQARQPIRADLKDTDLTLHDIDRLATRLIRGLLIAMPCIGPAIMPPAVAIGTLRQLEIIAIVGAIGLDVWRLVLILRARI